MVIYTIVGFILLVCALIYTSVMVWFVGRHAGYEFSYIGHKNLWWYIPLVIGMGYLWFLLITHAPFLGMMV